MYRNSDYQNLPNNIQKLLLEISAPLRLVAHLILVHDVASKLISELNKQFPNLIFDSNTVLQGAALHDIGKVVVPSELLKFGNLHEEAGYELLLQRGFSAQLAVIARDHSDWTNNNQIENLLVALSDKLWKGKREKELEELIINRIILSENKEHWEAFIMLDEIFEQLSSSADVRLSYHSSFSAI